MSWHEELSLEIEVEFQRLAGSTYSRIEDVLWTYRQQSAAGWSEFGQWWRKTTAGRRYHRERQARLARAKQSVVVAVRWCASCKKPFDVTMYRAERGHDRVCSPECRGAARKNVESVDIDGRRMPLARWAEESGIGLKTIWARLKRGWDPKRAVFTPL